MNALIWGFVARFSRQLIAFGVAILLARLLPPSAFGLVAMVTVFTSFALLFADFGFGAAIIQRQELRQEHLSSVFWVNVAAGSVLSLLVFLVAPLVARFYGEPMLTPLMRVLSVTFLVGSLSIVQRSVLRKRLEFRALAMADVTGVAVGGGVAVWMAFAGFGVWSLVAKALVGGAVTTAILWMIGRFTPAASFDRRAISELFGFSGNFIAHQALNYWTRNVDNLLVGRVIGSAALGLYSQAYSIFLLPLDNISNVVGSVMFASLSEIQQDRDRVRRVYMRMTRAIALLSFPVMAGLFVFAREFVLVTYGPKWIGMVPLLQVFALVGVTGSILTVTGNLYLSQGRADLQFRVGAGLAAHKIFWLVLAIFVTRDIRWVAAALAFASWINMYPAYYFAGRLVDLTFTQEVRYLSGVFGCALFSGSVMFVTRHALSDATGAAVTLLGGLLAGALSYWFALKVFRVAAYDDALSLVAARLKRQRA